MEGVDSFALDTAAGLYELVIFGGVGALVEAGGFLDEVVSADVRVEYNRSKVARTM